MREKEVTSRQNYKLGKANRVAKAIIRHESGVLGIILVALVVSLGAMTGGKFLSPANVGNVLLQSATVGVAAAGQTFVILSAGIDVSVGGIALMSSILGGQIMTGATSFLVVVAGIAAMLFFGMGVGTFNGMMVSRVGVPALIVTLGVWEASKGVAFLMCGGETILGIPAFITFIGGGRIGGVPIPVIIFIIVIAVSYLVLMHTKFGRSVYAVGGNPVSAWLSGVNTKNILMSVYMISGFLGGLAGLLLTGRTGCASTVSGGGLELDSIAAVTVGGVSIVGGRGNIIGAVIGVLIISAIHNGLNILGIHSAFQNIVKGVIIIIAVSIDYLRRR